jgi:hypothetical protein
MVAALIRRWYDPVLSGVDGGWLLARGFQAHGQAEKKSGSDALFGFRPNPAAMPFHDLTRNREAHSGALYAAQVERS